MDHCVKILILCCILACFAARHQSSSDGFSVSFDSTFASDSTLPKKSDTSLILKPKSGKTGDTADIAGNIRGTEPKDSANAKEITGVSVSGKDSIVRDVTQSKPDKRIFQGKNDSLKNNVTENLLNNAKRDTVRKTVASNYKRYKMKVHSISWPYSRIIKLFILILSLCVIASTIIFYVKRSERGRFMTTTRLSIMDKEVQRVCRYIEQNFADHDLSLDTICRVLVTGPAFIEALFQRDLGIQVEDFISQVRINRAKILLDKDSSLDINEIATSVGFIEPIMFSAVFQKVTGMSFSEYQSSLLIPKDIS